MSNDPNVPPQPDQGEPGDARGRQTPGESDRTQEFQRPTFGDGAPSDQDATPPRADYPPDRRHPAADYSDLRQPTDYSDQGYVDPHAPAVVPGADLTDSGSPVPVPVQKRYGEFVPALAGAVVGGALVGLASWASQGGHLPKDRLLALIITAGYPGDYAHGGASGSKAVIASAVGTGVCAGVLLVLLLLAGATARRSGARGLLFLAGWGATAPAVFLAHLVGTAIISGVAPDELSVSASLVYAGTWAAATGWIVGLASAIVRFGRRTLPTQYVDQRYGDYRV